MAYQYNAVGSAPKILNKTFIVENLEQLADNPYANRWGVLKRSSNSSYTEGETYTYGQIAPNGNDSASTLSHTLGSTYSTSSASVTDFSTVTACS